MRIVISKLLLVAILVLGLSVLIPRQSVHAEGGLTLTPATLTLNLKKGSKEQSAAFTITNSYDKLVTLHFSFEPSADTPSQVNPADKLRIKQNHVMLEAGQSLRQVVTLSDSDQLPPGSMLAELVITQANSGDGTIGVLPSIRMPLVLVKQDGAVSALALAGLAGPGLGLTMPSSITATVHNSGNMIAIPRGIITITGPGGVLRSGALNTSSMAVSPGDSLALATPLQTVKNAVWPGIYRVNLSYGLGGGQQVQLASTAFFYVAWWHAALLAGVTAAAVYGRTYIVRAVRHALKTRHPPSKGALLIGRDIS